MISICIPTYNRSRFLKECLGSICEQFSNCEIKDKVNIFILDNKSEDNTSEMVREFTDSFDNIAYTIDSEKCNLVQGIIKVAGMGNGEYLWVLSDDDLLEASALGRVINFIKNNTDIVICNLTGFFKDEKKKNLLKIDRDYIISGKKELFSILEKKFPAAFDYYTTLCSNWLIKRSLFESENQILKKYNSSLDMFPLPSLFFYSHKDLTSGLISESVVLNRGGNELWGGKGFLKRFFYKKNLWDDYYGKIVANNKEFVSKIFIKNIAKRKNYHFLEVFKQGLVFLFRKLGVYVVIKKILKYS